MGCMPSKQSVCRNCHSQCSPIRRSYSSHGHYSPPHDGDNHVVALTSTTLGYRLLDASNPSQQSVSRSRYVPEKNSKEFEVGVIEAKSWSKMIEEKIDKMLPKTPIKTPPSESEMINAWELMEGLDDSSPLLPQSTMDRVNLIPLDRPIFSSQEKDGDAQVSSKPLWKPLIDEKQHSSDHYGDDANKLLQNGKNEIMSHSKEKLILYFTSLRGVRKTYENCSHVRVILKNSGVRVDERDVSMHSGFKEELKELLGDQYGGGGLPKVFVGKKYIGGADEIRRFHDEFQLDKVLEGCEMVDDCSGGGDCEACGDIRFLPCEMCSGSCKIYYEVNSDEGEKDQVEESDYGFQRCPDCNENGLVRCSICCD